ncbi:bacteriohopanetetrol glucosamine biosynthesis glycosyltransferase HpnI [Cupriavidus sp. PET2-C1]
MTLEGLAGPAVAWLAAGYAVAAAWISRRASPGPAPACEAADSASIRPVSVLKPLCGAEPHLYENLATLCRQQHPAYQIVFGVRAADDPAIGVVERLRADFPACEIDLVVDPRVHGSNLKASNLINLCASARHAWLVVADSDIAVAPDYLARVTAPLADARVGVVTCLYRGHPVGGFWSRLGAGFIDHWFAPSVRIAHAGGSRSFSFGATIALRRDALAAIGGFEALSNRLADDFWLGELVRRQGLETVLSDEMVTTDVTESRLVDLWAHELRWMRTIRSLNPAGFAFTFITFTWPMLALAAWISPQPLVLAAVVMGGLARSFLAGGLGATLMAPLRDTLLLVEWAVALAGSQVRWRDRILPVRDPPAADAPLQPRAPAARAGMEPYQGAGVTLRPLPLMTEGTDNGVPERQSSRSKNGLNPPRLL